MLGCVARLSLWSGLRIGLLAVLLPLALAPAASAGFTQETCAWLRGVDGKPSVTLADVPPLKDVAVLKEIALTNVQVFVRPQDCVLAGKTNFLGRGLVDVQLWVLDAPDGLSLYYLAARPPRGFRLDSLYSEVAGSVVGDLELDGMVVLAAQDGPLVSSALPPQAVAFLRDALGAGDFRYDLKFGLNLVAAVDLTKGDLGAYRKRLGIVPASVVLQGELTGIPGYVFGKRRQPGDEADPSKVKQLLLRAVLPGITVPKAPPWLRSGEAGIEIGFQKDARGATPMVGLFAALTIDDHNSPVTFSTHIAVNRGLTGAPLLVEARLDGHWVHPFGAQWLTLDNVVLKLETGVTDTKVGFLGDAQLGSKRVTLAIEPQFKDGALLGGIFLGKLDSLTLSDLVTMLNLMAQGVAGGQAVRGDVAELDLTDLQVKVATFDDSDLKVWKGFQLKGNATLKGRALGAVDIDLYFFPSTVPNLKAHGKINAFDAGPVRVDDVVLDLLIGFSLSSHLNFSGKIQLFGTTADAVVKNTLTDVNGRAEMKIQNRFDASVEWRGWPGIPTAGSFKVTLKADFSDFLEQEAAKGLIALGHDADTQLDKAKKDVDAALHGVDQAQAQIDRLRADVQKERDATIGRLRAAEQRVGDLKNQVAAARAEVLRGRQASEEKLKVARQKVDELDAEIRRVQRHRAESSNIAVKLDDDARLAGLKTAKTSADFALDVARKAAALGPVDADPRVALVIAAEKTAEAALAALQQSMAWFYQHASVDADPRVVAKLAEKDAAQVALKTVQAALDAAQRAVGAAARISDFLGKQSGQLLVVRSAVIEGGADAMLGKSPGPLALDYVFMGKPGKLSVPWPWNVAEVKSGIKAIVDALVKTLL